SSRNTPEVLQHAVRGGRRVPRWWGVGDLREPRCAGEDRVAEGDRSQLPAVRRPLPEAQPGPEGDPAAGGGSAASRRRRARAQTQQAARTGAEPGRRAGWVARQSNEGRVLQEDP